METSALFAYHRAMDSDYARQMNEFIRKVPLREYLAVRDKPYKESAPEIEALLKKAKGEIE